MAKLYGPEEQAKLSRLIADGSKVLQEIEDLRIGLSESVKAIAEELEVKPSWINKAIKIAHKGNWRDRDAEHDEIHQILGVTKHLPDDED